MISSFYGELLLLENISIRTGAFWLNASPFWGRRMLVKILMEVEILYIPRYLLQPQGEWRGGQPYDSETFLFVFLVLLISSIQMH